MPINKETILSVYEDKLTLMQWLKTINKALDEAVLTGVEVRQKGNATYSFVVTFEDGTELESNEFVLAQGESVANAFIQNGHLYLTLTNGTNLDAGNLKPVTNFAINDSQHLIVNYGDGTSQDLGAIFSGNVNIDGNFTANSIVEKMSGYSFTALSPTGYTLTLTYVGVVKNGNKITFAIVGTIQTPTILQNTAIDIGYFEIPEAVGNKLINTLIGGGNILAVNNVQFVNAYSALPAQAKAVNMVSYKETTQRVAIRFYDPSTQVEANKTYFFRYESTFLLSNNLITE